MLRAQQFLLFVFFYWAGIQWAPRPAEGAAQVKMGTPAPALPECEAVAATLAATELVADVLAGFEAVAATLAATELVADVLAGFADAGSKTPHTHLVGWPHSENMSNLPMCRGNV